MNFLKSTVSLSVIVAGLALSTTSLAQNHLNTIPNETSLESIPVGATFVTRQDIVIPVGSAGVVLGSEAPDSIFDYIPMLSYSGHDPGRCGIYDSQAGDAQHRVERRLPAQRFRIIAAPVYGDFPGMPGLRGGRGIQITIQARSGEVFRLICTRPSETEAEYADRPSGERNSYMTIGDIRRVMGWSPYFLTPVVTYGDSSTASDSRRSSVRTASPPDEADSAVSAVRRSTGAESAAP